MEEPRPTSVEKLDQLLQSGAISEDARARTAALYAVGSVAAIAASMALMGFLVSSGFRAALEQIVS